MQLSRCLSYLDKILSITSLSSSMNCFLICSIFAIVAAIAWYWKQTWWNNLQCETTWMFCLCEGKVWWLCISKNTLCLRGSLWSVIGLEGICIQPRAAAACPVMHEIFPSTCSCPFALPFIVSPAQQCLFSSFIFQMSARNSIQVCSCDADNTIPMA